MTSIPSITAICARRAADRPPEPAMFNFLCQSRYPVRLLAVPGRPPGLLLGPYQPLPVSPARHSRSRPWPPTLSARTDLGLASGGPAPARIPGEAGGSTPPGSQDPLGVHYQPGYPSLAAKVRAAPPRLAASIIKTPTF